GNIEKREMGGSQALLQVGWNGSLKQAPANCIRLKRTLGFFAQRVSFLEKSMRRNDASTRGRLYRHPRCAVKTFSTRPWRFTQMVSPAGILHADAKDFRLRCRKAISFRHGWHALAGREIDHGNVYHTSELHRSGHTQCQGNYETG